MTTTTTTTTTDVRRNPSLGTVATVHCPNPLHVAFLSTGDLHFVRRIFRILSGAVYAAS